MSIIVDVSPLAVPMKASVISLLAFPLVTPVPPAVLTFDSADGSPIYVAAIAAGSTGKIYFTPGLGY